MKKFFLTLISITFSWTLNAHPLVNNSLHKMSDQIPGRFLSSSQTASYEWGCPVSEVVMAKSGPEAMQKVGRECMNEARRAAHEKPGVVDVINVSVIVPDVNITPQGKGFMLKGTFFLETLVLKGME